MNFWDVNEINLKVVGSNPVPIKIFNLIIIRINKLNVLFNEKSSKEQALCIIQPVKAMTSFLSNINIKHCYVNKGGSAKALSSA